MFLFQLTLTSHVSNEDFQKAFNSDMSENPKIWNGSGYGLKNGLEFYLFDSSVRRIALTKENPATFHMSLSTMDNYFDMIGTSEKIPAGYHTIWKVQAMEIVPSDALHEVPMSKRKCKFADEISGLEIFKVYSKKACQLECQIKQAAKICGCYPWFTPVKPQVGRHQLCDVYGNFCFRSLIENNNASDCPCLPTCHHIEFTHVAERSPIDMQACYSNSPDDYLGVKMSEIVDLLMKKGYSSFEYNYVEAVSAQLSSACR